MGRWAWVPSPWPRLGLSLLLLLLRAPLGAQPQASRVSAVAMGPLRPLRVLGLGPRQGAEWVRARHGASWPSGVRWACWDDRGDRGPGLCQVQVGDGASAALAHSPERPQDGSLRVLGPCLGRP